MRTACLKTKLLIMKTTFSFLFVCLTFLTTAYGQGKYGTKTGEINFEASVPSFEEVKAVNTNVSAVFDTATGNFAALALMKGFRFKMALMEEHFNENYVESSKYPKAAFKGTIKDLDISSLSDKKKYMIVGTLNLHGVDKKLEAPATVGLKDGMIVLSAKFVLLPEEFNIKIPSIVRNKIADKVDVSAVFNLKKQ